MMIEIRGNGDKRTIWRGRSTVLDNATGEPLTFTKYEVYAAGYGWKGDVTRVIKELSDGRPTRTATRVYP